VTPPGQVYRERLHEAAALPIRYIHLGGSREVIAARMRARAGHFMNPSLLDSQIAKLEPPVGANVLSCDVSEDPEVILMRARAWLAGGGAL
jgi:gluconokinase